MSTKFVIESSSFQKKYMLNIKNVVSCLFYSVNHSLMQLWENACESNMRSFNIYAYVLWCVFTPMFILLQVIEFIRRPYIQGVSHINSILMFLSG